MPDSDDIAAFLLAYVAECDQAGVNPLPVRELATLVGLIAAGTDGGLMTDGQSMN